MDAQLLTVQKLEEKERALQGSLGGVEKELTLRSQALELNKRKVRQMTWARAWLCCPTQPRSCLRHLMCARPCAEDLPCWVVFRLKVILQQFSSLSPVL